LISLKDLLFKISINSKKKGSGFVDPVTGKESFEPIYLYIT